MAKKIFITLTVSFLVFLIVTKLDNEEELLLANDNEWKIPIGEIPLNHANELVKGKREQDRKISLERIKIVEDYNIQKEKLRIEEELRAAESLRVEEELRIAEELITESELRAKKEKRVKTDTITASRGLKSTLFTATAYDLTVASCGKKTSHKAYGITRSGYSLVGQNRESSMTIATDPRVIPMGTKVLVEFLDENWQHWNGTYTARDTGSAIKGNKIDIFYKDTGDKKTDQIIWDFGKRQVRVTILKD